MFGIVHSKVVNVSRSFADDDAARHSSEKQPSYSDKEPDYANTLVRKPWGSEYLLFQNQWTAGWLLNLAAGHSTSMHCHPRKDTSLIVVRGKVRCQTFSGVFDREAGDAVFLEKGAFHQTYALPSHDATLLEVETPPMKRDLVRLHDHYGRVGAGYEGAAHFAPNARTLDLGDEHSLGSSSLDFQGRRLKVATVRGTDLPTLIHKTALDDLVVLLNDGPTYGPHTMSCGKVVESREIWATNISSSNLYSVCIVTRHAC